MTPKIRLLFVAAIVTGLLATPPAARLVARALELDNTWSEHFTKTASALFVAAVAQFAVRMSEQEAEVFWKWALRIIGLAALASAVCLPIYRSAKEPGRPPAGGARPSRDTKPAARPLDPHANGASATRRKKTGSTATLPEDKSAAHWQ